MLTIMQLLRKKRNILSKNNKFNFNPQEKGLCLKLLTMSPKKPNSALRKVAKIKLCKLKKDVIAFIPGEGPCIKEHCFVLVQRGTRSDLPGVKYKVIRGTLDSLGISKRSSSRSKYGTKKLNNKKNIP